MKTMLCILMLSAVSTACAQVCLLGGHDKWKTQYETALGLGIKDHKPQTNGTQWHTVEKWEAGELLLQADWYERGGVISLARVNVGNVTPANGEVAKKWLAVAGLIVGGEKGHKEMLAWINANITKGAKKVVGGIEYELHRAPWAPKTACITIRPAPPPDPGEEEDADPEPATPEP